MIIIRIAGLRMPWAGLRAGAIMMTGTAGAVVVPMVIWELAVVPRVNMSGLGLAMVAREVVMPVIIG